MSAVHNEKRASGDSQSQVDVKAETGNKTSSPASSEFGIEHTLAGAYTDADDEPDLHWRSWIVLAAAMVNYLGSTMILTASGFWAAEIIASVGGANQKLWIANVWNPISCIIAPPLCLIGDKCGRRNLWLVSLFFGVIGNILVAAGKNAGTVIVGVAIWGLAFSNTGNIQAAAAETLPRRHRGTVAMGIQVGGYCGTTIALLGGAGFVVNNPGGYAGYRSFFWLTAAVHAVAFVLVFFAYRPPPVPNPTGASMLHRALDFDQVGTLLYAAALVPFLVGLLSGGETHPWHSANVIAPLVIGAVFLFVFIAHQRFIKKDGIFHHGLFKSRNIALCFFAVAVEGIVYIVFNNFIGLETAVLFNGHPYGLAIRFAVFIWAAVLGSAIYTFIAYRYKRLNEIMIWGFVLFLAASIGLATVKPGSAKVIIGWCALAGFGFAGPISAVFGVAQLSVDPSLLGLISGLVVSTRSIGGTLGPACAQAIFTSKIGKYLPSYIAKAGLKAGLPEASLPLFVGGLAANNITMAASAPGVTPEMLAAGGHAALEAYAAALKFIWIFVAPWVFAALIASCLMINVRKHMNFIIEQPIEEIHHKHHGTSAKA